MNISSKTGLLSILFVIPFTLHSTDIFHSSEGLVKIHANLNPHIIPADPKLGNTVLIVSAPIGMKTIHLVTSCEHKESILYKSPAKEGKMLYVIQVSFPVSCDATDISLGDRESIFTDTTLSLPLESLGKAENGLINTDSAELLSIMRGKTIPISAETGTTVGEKLQYMQTLYKNLDIVARSDIARDILQDREHTKYISPVAGYTIPVKDNIIPGAGRPYRKDTTDGIHHGWDIMAPIGTPVRALSKGKVIRIKNNWNWSELSAMKRGKLSKDDEGQNLDTFRGNQVWLQTMDGNVTFYSHLSRISPDITIGSDVDSGTYLGNIGISGVPDKNYKDVHLHFEIQQNPFLKNMKNPTNQEIMRWDYIGAHLNSAQVHGKMREIF